jgi:hypothetical protein
MFSRQTEGPLSQGHKHGPILNFAWDFGGITALVDLVSGVRDSNFEKTACLLLGRPISTATKSIISSIDCVLAVET